MTETSYKIVNPEREEILSGLRSLAGTRMMCEIGQLFAEQVNSIQELEHLRNSPAKLKKSISEKCTYLFSTEKEKEFPDDKIGLAQKKTFRLAMAAEKLQMMVDVLEEFERKLTEPVQPLRDEGYLAILPMVENVLSPEQYSLIVSAQVHSRKTMADGMVKAIAEVLEPLRKVTEEVKRELEQAWVDAKSLIDSEGQETSRPFRILCHIHRLDIQYVIQPTLKI